MMMKESYYPPTIKLFPRSSPWKQRGQAYIFNCRQIRWFQKSKFALVQHRFRNKICRFSSKCQYKKRNVLNAEDIFHPWNHCFSNSWPNSLESYQEMKGIFNKKGKSEETHRHKIQ